MKRRKKVLLVEDVAVSRIVAELALKRKKFSVSACSTGEEAVTLHAEHSTGDSFDLILMDIMLPGMNGIESVALIRAFEAKHELKPCIILGLTANVTTEDLRRYERGAMNGCIQKGNVVGESVHQAIAVLAKKPDEFVVFS
jgi:CheY-like chemotaxis protein